MAGYILPNAPGVIRTPKGGWHDAGDIVTLDERRVVTIKGRVKRFAKIGGEMVSLAAVEALAAGLWPDTQHVVVWLPDETRASNWCLSPTRPMLTGRRFWHTRKPRAFPSFGCRGRSLSLPQFPCQEPVRSVCRQPGPWWHRCDRCSRFANRMRGRQRAPACQPGTLARVSSNRCTRQQHASSRNAPSKSWQARR